MTGTAGAALAFDMIGMTFPDGTEALRDISFTVDRGEFVTIVGPSGCGKSTLLKIASGERSKSEQLGYGDAEFVPWQIGATM